MLLVQILFNQFKRLMLNISEGLQSLREAMIWTLPCVLIGAMFIAAAYLVEVSGPNPDLSLTLKGLSASLSRLIPVIVASFLAYILSVKKRLPPMPLALLALSCTLLIYLDATQAFQSAASFMLLIGIVIPFVTVALVKVLYEKKWTMLTNSELAGSSVKAALNLTIPGVIVFAVIFFGLKMLVYFGVSLAQAGWFQEVSLSAYASALLYTFLNSLLWLLGIHGANLLQPLMTHLNEMSSATGGFVNETFLGAFVFIGGSGATFSLILAILLFSKNKALRLLSYASIPIAFLNINELLLFGLPVILNPRMLIPFVSVPLINLLTSYMAISFGWVTTPRPDIQMPLNALIGLNAYLATNHDLHAVFLQMLNVAIGVGIYSLFIKKMNDESRAVKNIHLKSLDMTYTHINQEASLFSYDPISSTNELRKKLARQKQHMEYLAGLEFYLEYQPQVAPHNKQFVGCEALLRARNEEGEIVMPYVFLPWFEAADMMKSIDLWVAEAAVKQDDAWQKMGILAPIKINISSDTLMNKASTDLIVEKISQAQGRVSIEIVEQSFSDGLENVVDAIARIQAFGAKVYIDDFGTGYSSLSYLNSLNADAIKIDRSFVLGLTQPDGEKVMAGIFNFAEALGLEIVVEGVETEAQLAKIPKSVPFSVQGWLYSKALPAEEVPVFIQRYSGIH